MGAEVKNFDFGDKRAAKRLDLSSQYALIAAEEAVTDSGIVSGENVKAERFGELRKSVGNVSQKVLTANLRSMEEDGLLTRRVYAEVPPRVEYTLTETGMSLRPVLDAMQSWGESYKEKRAGGETA